jgi:transcriptional regulator with XRE-family HTH domain
LSKTIGSAHDASFKQDLNIVARGLPGKGEALARLIQAAGVTQETIAQSVHCDRSAVAHWIAERKWPKPRRLLNVLVSLHIDRKLLAEAAIPLIGGDMAEELSKACDNLNLIEVTKEKMLEILAGDDDHVVSRTKIFQVFVPQVTLAVALRAAGLKGGEACDPKAAGVFFAEWRLHQKEEADRSRHKNHSYDGAEVFPGYKPRS